MTEIKGEEKHNSLLVCEAIETSKIEFDKKERFSFRLNKPVKLFEGRRDELERIHIALVNERKSMEISHTVSIVGHGGIGKTELTKKYAENYMAFYSNIVFINAERLETIVKSFQDLANKVRIKLNEYQDYMKKREMVDVVQDIYLYFIRNGSTLFIFDNVEDHRVLKKFTFNNICGSNNIYTLITSRCRNWNVEEIVLIHLGGFTDDEAMNYLENALENEKKEDLKMLIKLLECFPLALSQAVGYIQQSNSNTKGKNLTVKDYLCLYEEEITKLVSEVDDVYNRIVLNILRISLKKIEDIGECGKLAMSMFKIMSYLPSHIVDIEQLFFELENDFDKRRNAVQLLDKYCLINALVKEYTRIDLMEKNEEETVLRDALTVLKMAVSEEQIVSVWEHSSKYSQLIDDFYSESVYGYYEETPVHLLASYRNDSIAIGNLVKHANCIDSKNRVRNTPLHNSSRNGNINIVEVLVERGATLIAKNDWNETPLHLAVSNDNAEVVKYLTEQDNTLASQNDDTLNTPVDLAVLKGYTGVVEILIPQKNESYLLNARFNSALRLGDFDKCNEMIESIRGEDSSLLQSMFLKNVNFYTAGGKCDFKLIEYLIGCGIDINTRDSFGRTPLIFTADNTNYRAMKLLLDKGADPGICDENGNTVLHYVALTDGIDAFKLLLKKRADLNIYNKNDQTPLHCAVGAGSLKILKLLIDEEYDVDTDFRGGWTPLIIAASYKEFQAMKLLLEMGADPNVCNENGDTALHYIVTTDAVDEFELLLEKGADPNIRNLNSQTPFHCAVGAGSLKIMQLLFEKGIDINMPTEKGWSPLIIAASYKEFQAMKLLLEMGADPNICNENGDTALHYIVTTDAVDEFELLLEKGADPNIRNLSSQTPFHCAVGAGSLKIMQQLYERGVDINKPTEKGWSPLIIAASYNVFQSMKLLLEMGADPNTSNENGDTALHFVAKTDAVEEFKLLLGKGANFNFRNKNKQTPFYCAVVASSLKIMQLLFERGVDINIPDKIGCTPVCVAAINGKLQALKWLLEKGADPKVVNNYGTNLLHSAAFGCDVDGLKFVIQLGFDLTEADKKGNSSMHYAAHGCNKAVIEFLFGEGIDPNLTDDFLLTPLHDICCLSGDIDTVKLLIKLGANPNSLNIYNRSPLHFAAHKDNYDAAIFLIEEGAEINARDKRGRSPLLKASAKCHLGMINLLLENDADVNVYDNKGRSPLHHLTRNGKLEGVKLLLKHGADPCKLDKAGHTLLHLAAVHFQYRAVDYFIQNVKNIDVNARDDDHKTPLHLAASRGRVDIVGLLIRKGAETNAKDKFDNTPLDFAIKYNHTKVIDIFNKALEDREADISLMER